MYDLSLWIRGDGQIPASLMEFAKQERMERTTAGQVDKQTWKMLLDRPLSRPFFWTAVLDVLREAGGRIWTVQFVLRYVNDTANPYTFDRLMANEEVIAFELSPGETEISCNPIEDYQTYFGVAGHGKLKPDVSPLVKDCLEGLFVSLGTCDVAMHHRLLTALSHTLSSTIRTNPIVRSGTPLPQWQRVEFAPSQWMLDVSLMEPLVCLACQEATLSDNGLLYGTFNNNLHFAVERAGTGHRGLNHKLIVSRALAADLNQRLTDGFGLIPVFDSSGSIASKTKQILSELASLRAPRSSWRVDPEKVFRRAIVH